jgi:hypothetical protein
MHMSRIFLGSTLIAMLAFGASAQAQGRPGIVLYQEDNFRGNALPLDGPVRNLVPLHFNDRVSSVQVNYGAWRLCDDEFFRGRCIVVTRDEPKLDRLGMDDRISSVMPVDDRRDDRRDRRDRYRDRDRDRDYDRDGRRQGY